MSIDFLLQDVTELLGLVRSAAASDRLPVSFASEDSCSLRATGLVSEGPQGDCERLTRQIDDILRLLNDDSLVF